MFGAVESEGDQGPTNNIRSTIEGDRKKQVPDDPGGQGAT